jgi:hypothetical protein
MQNESLGKLKAAFEDWRSKKRYPREAVPADLLERARAAARRHGPAAVARATKVDRGRLKTGRRVSRRSTKVPVVRVPAFSRVELAASAATPPPFAEVEMPTGVKVRLLMQTDAALELLTTLCGAGGAR